MAFEKYSEGNPLLHDIVFYDRIPAKIQRFWNSMVHTGDSLKRWNALSVLNTMLRQEIPEGIDLMSWYEIFRDIFVMRAREEESRALAVKSPRFTTFDRTFEQLAFLPEYWFDCAEVKTGPRDAGTKNQPLNPARLLFSFERYMYNQEGGACWSALDWGMPKYCFRVVCESQKRPQFNVAALLLAAHCIASGKMGLYVGEKTDVELSYAGIPDGGKTDSPLLKYFHFDRFTGLSFIRKHELELDADRASETPMFELQWQYLAVMTEFILQNNSARATRTTCSRVSTSSFIRALNVLRGINALGGVPIDGNKKAAAVLSRIENAIRKCGSLTRDERRRLQQSIDNEIEKLNSPDEAAKPPMLECIDRAIPLLDSSKLAKIEPTEMLSLIGIQNPQFIPTDFYLRKQGIDSGKAFWEKAEEVFETILPVYSSIYAKTIKRFTKEEYARHKGEQFLDKDGEFLKKILLNGQMDELRGRMNGERLRTALRTLLLEEQFELNCGQMARILDSGFNDENLVLYFPTENRDCFLPGKWLTTDIAPQKAGETLRGFCLEILTEFSRSRKTGKIARDFVSKINRKMAWNASNRLWSLYFSRENEDICLARWMLSLDQSLEILNSKEQKFEKQTLPKGKARARLIEENRNEFLELSAAKGFDRDDAIQRLRSFDGYSLENVLPTNLRNLVILDLIARLMVETANISPFDAIWSDEKMLKTFFTHMLYAAPKKADMPLPFHIGIYSDKLLRDSRSADDQRDNIDRLLKHKFDNEGERYLFQLMLLDHLKQTDKPQDKLKAIIENPAMANFVSVNRLVRLRPYL